LSQLHVNQIMGVLRRTFEGLIDLADVAHLDVTNRGSVFLSRALASFAVAQLAALEPAEAAQAVTDGAGDNGVDAIHYDRATKTLYVVQSKWFGSGRGSFDVSETMKLVKGFDDLVAQRFDRFNAKVAAKRGMVEAAFLDDKATYVLVMVHTPASASRKALHFSGGGSGPRGNPPMMRNALRIRRPICSSLRSFFRVRYAVRPEKELARSLR
jgi:hypothetical protein